MGGDFGPRVTIPSCLQALSRHPNLMIRVFGHQDEIYPYTRKISRDTAARFEVVHTDHVIAMDAKPSMALRHGKGSSMHMALKQVSDGLANACVSAGNTGALMVLGRSVLKMLPGIDRPAIISAVPTHSGHSYMLDLGANVDCGAENLLQFAIMGSTMAQAVDQIEQPRVGLLNVGQEEIKGNEQVKLASRLIEEHGRLNYIGYIEGDDIFSGRCDVVVCDGFVGNIALKGSEGLANLIRHKVKHSFRHGLYRRFLGLLAKPVLAELNRQMDPSRRNGASLLGLQGIVVKSHGGANKKCFRYALDQAIAEIEMDLPSRISQHIRDQLV